MGGGGGRGETGEVRRDSTGLGAVWASTVPLLQAGLGAGKGMRGHSSAGQPGWPGSGAQVLLRARKALLRLLA